MALHRNRTQKLFSRLATVLILILMVTSCTRPTPVQLSPTAESVAPPTATEEPEMKPSATQLPEGDTISKIQGAGHISPYRNQNVSDVEGVVTVTSFDGFYMQSIAPDDDPATSEGIFVFTGTIPTVRKGDQVMVSGRVEEMTPGGGYGNLSRTQIDDVEVEIASRNNNLPAPTVIGRGGRVPPTDIIDDDTNGYIGENVYFDPESDGIDFYESLEGMLVQVNDAVVVGPTNQFKEIAILADRGEDASVRTPRGGVVIREDDYNPERIILDDYLLETPFVNVGDYAEEPIIGVMDFDFGNFKLLVTERVSFEDGGLQPERVKAPAAENQLRVANYNVMNLSAVQPNRIASLAEQIVYQMDSPDIIALQEVMDNDGSEGDDEFSADQTYQGIIDGILALGGPVYGFVDIDPIPDAEGGIPLGNIRVGFLYRLDRGLSLANAPKGDSKTAVEVVDEGGVPKLSLNPGRVAPTNPAFYSSRRPLVVTFVYQGETIFIINNHFVSKGEDRDLFGEFQPPILDSEYQRVEQAQVVHDFVLEIMAIDPESKVIVTGDMNDFQFSNPINLLEGEILNNLIETLPVEERYTYVYDGNSQALDQMLVSDGLFEQLSAYEILHVNAEFYYENRFSDHDILMATFDMD
jgi:predicted extracellular nuclease